MSESTTPLGETLDCILSRLAKLESIAGVSSLSNGSVNGSTPSSSSAKPIIGNGTSASSSGGAHPAVSAYKTYLSTCLDPFVTACVDLGPRTESIGEALSSAWSAQGTFLEAAVVSKKPSDNAKLQPYFKRYQDAASKVVVSRDEWENHEKTVKECFGMLQWIVMPGKPKDYVQEMVGAVSVVSAIVLDHRLLLSVCLFIRLRAGLRGLVSTATRCDIRLMLHPLSILTQTSRNQHRLSSGPTKSG